MHCCTFRCDIKNHPCCPTCSLEPCTRRAENCMTKHKNPSTFTYVIISCDIGVDRVLQQLIAGTGKREPLQPNSNTHAHGDSHSGKRLAMGDGGDTHPTCERRALVLVYSGSPPPFLFLASLFIGAKKLTLLLTYPHSPGNILATRLQGGNGRQ